MSLDKLPADVRKRAEQHGKTVSQEMKKLQKNFCVNQWRVKKKK